MKTIQLLVTEIEDELCVFDAGTLALSGIDETSAANAFGAQGYWLTLTLKDATYADQQKALREAAQDETLIAQKRFCAAVSGIKKRVCSDESASLPEVSETWFTAQPPLVANAINAVVLNHWYPVGTKTADFFSQLQTRQAESEKANV